MTALVEVRALRKHYPVRRPVSWRAMGSVRALDGVDLNIQDGQCLGVVGESGSGKTTLGRCLLRLIEATDGQILFDGEDLRALSKRELRARRRHFQMIFQDPDSALDPRMKVGKILREPLEVHATVAPEERTQRVRELLAWVGLPEDAERRHPHEFSGGQRQRIGIARALAPEPRFLVADEPVSALDVSLRAQVLNLLADLRSRLRVAMVFIAHDLTVVEQIADRVAVLYLGRMVEQAESRDLFGSPRHPYTVSLLSAVPVPEPGSLATRIVLPGEPPSPADPPSGCRFHPRCPIAKERCRRDEPQLTPVVAGHEVACHYPGELVVSRRMAERNGTF